jgi:imidazolonepropionase-like amidohydrolase
MTALMLTTTCYSTQAAHNAGIRVCSHARSDESIIQCLQYGVDIIYHASFISDSTMSALAVQKDRAFVVPALNWLVGTLYDAEAFGCKCFFRRCTATSDSSFDRVADPIAKAESVGYGRELEVATAGLKEMHKRGIKVGHRGVKSGGYNA